MLSRLSLNGSESTIWNPSMNGFVAARPNSVAEDEVSVELSSLEAWLRMSGSREEELGRLDPTACVGRSSMKRDARSSVNVEELTVESGRGGSKEVSVSSESDRGRFVVDF